MAVAWPVFAEELQKLVVAGWFKTRDWFRSFIFRKSALDLLARHRPLRVGRPVIVQSLETAQPSEAWSSARVQIRVAAVIDNESAQRPGGVLLGDLRVSVPVCSTPEGVVGFTRQGVAGRRLLRLLNARRRRRRLHRPAVSP